VTPNRWHYLLLCAYSNWDFPKGMVEPGEDPLQAAIRETAEETTLSDLHFRWGYSFTETAPYNQGRKVARYYLAESPAGDVSLPVSAELGRPEHDEFRWCGYGEAVARVTPRVKRVLVWAHKIIGPASP
jgi:bis(5'-nucleosidyl)-tetraphosphatase